MIRALISRRTVGIQQNGVRHNAPGYVLSKNIQFKIRRISGKNKLITVSKTPVRSVRSVNLPLHMHRVFLRSDLFHANPGLACKSGKSFRLQNLVEIQSPQDAHHIRQPDDIVPIVK